MTDRHLKNRKLNRLTDYDYAQPGYYFVTICTRNRVKYFGYIKNDYMCLNIYGAVLYRQWSWLAAQYSYIGLDEFVVMPNHVHGIVIIKDIQDVGTGRDLSLPNKIKSLSELIGAFKTTSSRLIHEHGLVDFAWQRSFYDHIIEDDDSLNEIRTYIRYNPKFWRRDRNYN